MAKAFQDGWYLIGLHTEFNEILNEHVSYEIIVDGPYMTHSAAVENKAASGRTVWPEYLSSENFETPDGDSR